MEKKSSSEPACRQTRSGQVENLSRSVLLNMLLVRVSRGGELTRSPELNFDPKILFRVSPSPQRVGKGRSVSLLLQLWVVLVWNLVWANSDWLASGNWKPVWQSRSQDCPDLRGFLFLKTKKAFTTKTNPRLFIRPCHLHFLSCVSEI